MTEKILILDFGSQYTQLIARAVREGGFVDCGDLVVSPVWTEQFEDGERVLWGGLRMLRRAGA